MGTHLTGEEKGAVLLKCLAPEVVEGVLAQLRSDQSLRMRNQLNRLQPGPELDQALEEILQELGDVLAENTQGPGAVGSRDFKPVLALVPKNQPAVAPRPHEPELDAEALTEPLAALTELTPERLAQTLDGENPRTVSLVLNFLNVGLAGDLFKRLSPGLRNEVTVQFSSLVMPGREVMRQILMALLQKSRRPTDRLIAPEGMARHRKMADMLRLLDKPERLEVLTALEAKDPGIAEVIKKFLYQFEDLLRVDNRSMQKLLMELDAKSLANALKGASDPIRNKVVGNLSKRAQENLKEEMEYSPSIPKEAIERAQGEVTAIIQRLDLAGELVLV